MTGTDADYEATRRDGVLRVRRPTTEWLSTGWNGGRRTADCAYNISVPAAWNRTDLGAYVDERLERARFETAAGEFAGPALLTGVDVADARGARRGPVTAYATAGISNPAALPMEPDAAETAEATAIETGESATGQGRGTVNVVVGTTRALEPGALANLIAVAAEAKAATLLAEIGFPGTTTDAIVAGHDPSGSPAAFSGSGTEVGAATRACVRDAVRASLAAHYAAVDADPPESVADATYGVSTDGRAEVFRPPADDGWSEPHS
ncbi:adenosylcobinamide amidohydrolase [Natrinema salaciae]|uniref:Adenosylcobinamide hydrolase n=1 Tax=Natrinema salaciae TaxID=1186196 RepID=A0A1H8ZAP8_9EURY|nr:adenosylcobinamide amidohydrolase [Natrinema salaciae]SEP61411.1 adenosylcobinamide hydrolase [Natrinema salaciae]